MTLTQSLTAQHRAAPLGLARGHHGGAQLLAPPIRRSKTPAFAAVRPVIRASSADAAAQSSSATQDAADLLRKAAGSDTLVRKEDIFKAVKALDKQRLKGGEEWYRCLGGDKSPGRRWKLVWTIDKKELENDRKGVAEGKGKFFPLTAAQGFDRETQSSENGVYLGHVASLVFTGPHTYNKEKLIFDFWNLGLKVGPWKFNFSIKRGDKDAEFDASDKRLPFFLFIYIDDHILVAKGRGGGWAYWARTDPKWELEHGIV